MPFAASVRRNLSVRQIFARPQLGIGTTVRRDCSIFGARRHQLEMGICHDFPSPQQINCSNNSAAAINSRGLAHRRKQPRSWMRWYSCATTVLLFGLMQISVAVKSDSAHIISCDGSPLRNGISAHVSMGRWARHAGGGVAVRALGRVGWRLVFSHAHKIRPRAYKLTPVISLFDNRSGPRTIPRLWPCPLLVVVVPHPRPLRSRSRRYSVRLTTLARYSGSVAYRSAIPLSPKMANGDALGRDCPPARRIAGGDDLIGFRIIVGVRIEHRLSLDSWRRSSIARRTSVSAG